MSNRLLRRDHRTPTLDLNFLAMNEATFDRRITFSRTSHATMFDATGKLTFAPNNLLLRSEDFATSWTNPGAAITVTGDAIAAPNGTLSADLVADNATTTSNYGRSQTAAVLDTTPHIFSIYIKKKDYTFVQINTATGTNRLGYFNLDTGVVSNTSGVTGSGMIDVGDGWWRCWLAFTPAAGQTSCTANIIYCTSDSTSTHTGVIGTGTYFWGAQLERVTYETSPRPYIATTTAAYYGPRLEYDPVTLAAKGLLVEEARTNLFTSSEEFANAAWVESNIATISEGSTIAPSNLGRADTITASVGTAAALVYQSVTGVAGTNYSISFFVKKNTHRYIAVDLQGSANNYACAVFDLDGGTTSATQTSVGASSGTIVSTSQTDVGSGWYRLNITASIAISGSFVFWIGFAPAATGNTFSTQGQISSTWAGTESFYVWGAQLEAGSFPTSYIPTTTASVTRAVESCYIDAGGLSFFNRLQGTVVSDAQKSTATARGGVAGFGHTGAGTRSIYTDGQNNGKLRAYIETPTLEFGELTLADYTANSPFRIALAYQANNTNAAAASVLGTTDNAVILPDSITRFTIGSVKASNLPEEAYLNGHVARTRYWPYRIANSELRARSV
jgi:hypothetical protein